MNQSFLNIVPRWQNFTKSGHTGFDFAFLYVRRTKGKRTLVASICFNQIDGGKRL